MFSGMLGVTLFGIFLTPVFYYVIQRFGGEKPVAIDRQEAHKEPAHEELAARWRSRFRRFSARSRTMLGSRAHHWTFWKQASLTVVLTVLCVGSTLAKRQAKESTPAKNGATVKRARAKIAYEPTDRYAVQQIQGWTALVNKSFLETQPELAKQTRALLLKQLLQIVRRVPAEAVAKLRTIHIWVEEKEPHHPCMVYHPNIKWLRENGMNPDKARCVEIANAAQFPRLDQRPALDGASRAVHGYHNQFLDQGFENAEIQSVFQGAMKAKRYRSVPRNNGQTAEAYAATNAKEYFAETSEAYFGTNDFYPFVRAELKKHDPEMFRLLETLWHPVAQD